MNVPLVKWLFGTLLLLGGGAYSASACHEGGPMGFASDNPEALSVDISSSSTFAFASTSGTMGCSEWHLSERYEQDRFLLVNWDHLAEEAAIKPDVYTQGLALLAGCPSQEQKAFGDVLRQNHARLFSAVAPNSADDRQTFRQRLNRHLESASVGCRLSEL
jgi:hypothetical protein